MHHQEKSAIQLLSDISLSILAQGLWRSAHGVQFGAFVGAFVGIILAILFRSKGDSEPFALVALGTIVFGLLGFIIAGLIGLIQGTLKAYYSKQLYTLYVHFMVWLGAAPPPTYEYLLSNTFSDLGIKRATTYISFWLSFWALEGLILGIIGGTIFGAFSFINIPMGEWLFLILFTALVCGLSGAFFAVAFVPYLWFIHKIMQKLKPISFHTRYLDLHLDWLFWLAGGKIGEKLFRRIFGADF